EMVPTVITALQSIYWSGDVKGFEYREKIETLALYGTCEWFTDAQQSQMLDILRSDILTAGHALQDEIGEVWMMSFIKAAWRERATYEDPRTSDKDYSRARALGAVLASGERERLGMINNLQNMHWVACVVDIRQERVLYGDPFKKKPDSETKEALSWWITHHTGRTYTWDNLAVPSQMDGFNCGILSHIALGHHFLPAVYPLINGTGNSPADARLQMLLRIINRHLD
ncbi:hypothetical protein B0H15DRAFT_765216, partial [Mycena belliarum]